MKKILLMLVLFSAASFGQAGGIPGNVVSGSGTPSGNCLSTAYLYVDFTTGNSWYCPNTASSFQLAGGNSIARTLQKAETATADASVLSYTPVAVAGTYDVCFVASVSSATSGVIGFTLSWTDSNGNARSNIAQALTQLGTAAPALTFTVSASGNYSSCQEIDTDNSAAAIIVKWVGGGTTAAKVSASISRLN